ncbi:MAG: hypothetical protein P4L41_04455 [Flavipsychrobacter sp.]|nr:hypothetical protein [Flavipsychrobacter sp.]
MQKAVRIYIPFILAILLSACTKSKTTPLQPSGLSGTYNGWSYRNIQINAGGTSSNTWDTTLNTHVTITQYTRYPQWLVLSFNVTDKDTLTLDTPSTYSIPSATSHYYGYISVNSDPWEDINIDVYYFASHDSIYIIYFNPPGGGHGILNYFQGKK